MGETENSFTIGQVSDMLGIPPATLRFWEEKGLLSVQKSKNRYRRYTAHDLIQIADVMFFRSLGIPIAEMQELETSYSLAEHAQHIKALQNQLEAKILSYQTMYQHAQIQAKNLMEVQRLQQHFGQFETIPFHAVEPFDLLEQDKLLRYIQNPSCYVRYFDSQDMSTETRCIITEETDPAAHFKWVKNPNSRFVTILIREKVNQSYASDIEDSLVRLQQTFRTGDILAQYLMTANDAGERIDFLKGFVEVFPR